MPILADKRDKPLPNPVPKYLRKTDTNEIFDFTRHLWNRGDMVPFDGGDNVPPAAVAAPVTSKPDAVSTPDFREDEDVLSFESRVQEVKEAMAKIPMESWTSFGPSYSDIEKLLKRKVPKAEYSVAIRELKKEAPDETKTSDT